MTEKILWNLILSPDLIIIAKVFSFLFGAGNEIVEFNSMNEKPKTLIAAEFVFDSGMLGNEIGRIWIGDFMFNGKIDECGNFGVNVPSGELVRFTYGDTLQFSREIFIPVQTKIYFVGKYDWDNGNILLF